MPTAATEGRVLAEEHRDPGDRYELLGPLGSGSFGEVYRVFDRSRGCEVALKALRKVGGVEIYRFKREFRTLVGLDHPNLIDLHELYSVDGEWMLTMELVDGVRFDHWLRPPAADADPDADQAAPASSEVTALPALDVARLIEAFAQLGDGLHALHLLGKLHRDIKPSNVLVASDGRVVILDFGLVADAEHPDPTHHEGRSIGTAAYMSPEQAADLPLTPASDWYAVGVMLYHALTGRRPFPGSSSAVLLRKATEDPPPPRQIDAAVPAELDRLCTRLLDRDPSRRPGGAEVLAALGRQPSATTMRLAAPRPSAAGRSEHLGRFLDLLHQAFADSRERAVVAVVLGPAGSGKTTLLETFLAAVRKSDDPLLFGGRVIPSDRTEFPVLDAAVDQIGNFILGLPPADIAAVAADLVDLVPLFPTLRRLPALDRPALPTATPVEPAEVERRAFAALIRLVRRLGASRRMVGWIDDAHAAVGHGYRIFDTDPAGTTPILLIYLHRSEHTDTPVLRALRNLQLDVRWIDLPAAGEPV